MPRATVFLVITAIASEMAVAQPAFEVTSIRRHVLPPGQMMFRFTEGFAEEIHGNRVTGRMLTLTDLICDAYHVRDFQIEDVPDWGKTGRGVQFYDLEATTPGDSEPSVEQVRLMLQSALAERFQLKLRHESKELAVYNLTVAKGGPKMVDASSPQSAKISAPPGGIVMRGGVPFLLKLMSSRTDRPVLDKTSLTGTYAFPWTNPDANGDPSIFSWLQDEMGLKLEPARAQVQILAIEQVEKASDN